MKKGSTYDWSSFQFVYRGVIVALLFTVITIGMTLIGSMNSLGYEHVAFRMPNGRYESLAIVAIPLALIMSFAGPWWMRRSYTRIEREAKTDREVHNIEAGMLSYAIVDGVVGIVAVIGMIYYAINHIVLLP